MALLFRFIPAISLTLVTGAIAIAQPVLSGFSTSVAVDDEGVFVYLFVDGSAGPRSILISAAGPGYASQTSSRVVADPQIEVLDPSGNRVAYNNDRSDSLLADGSLPSYARTAKDAALRLSLATGAYVVRITGVQGATGVVGIDVIDSSARPGLASWALRARGDASVTPVQLRYSGGGSMNMAMFLSGPNLPVTNPMEDPRLTFASFTVFGNGNGTFSATTTPFNETWDALTGGTATIAARFRSPVTGDGRNAGHSMLLSLPPSMPITLNVQNQAAPTNGMFLLEVHNVDNPLQRAPVIYAGPQSLTLATGAAGVLRALAGGDSLLSVLLEKDGAVVGSFSSNQFIILEAGAGHSGSYRVRATNASGMALSSTAIVTVTPPPPFISASPVSTSLVAGQSITLTATVSGTGLSYQWLKDGTPIPGATLSTLTFPSIQESDSGSYALRVTNAGGTTTSSPGVLTVLPWSPGRLTNLSVRAFAGLGDRILIVGFTLSGPGAKPLVLRGIGPGLAAFGVTNTIPDPRIGLFVGSNEIANNNDWFNDDGRALGAFPLIAGSKDSVVTQNLSAQSFTAQVTGIGGAVGDTLVEVYDGNSANSALRLVNLSTRTQLEDGQRLIVGLTVAGRTSTRLLLRAVGPTLAAFGVSSAHPDPQIELYSGSTLIAQNDQWRGDDGRSAGAFPLLTGSNDAALVFPLSAGGYSVHVLGARATSGIVLVEVYEIP